MLIGYPFISNNNLIFHLTRKKITILLLGNC